MFRDTSYLQGNVDVGDPAHLNDHILDDSAAETRGLDCDGVAAEMHLWQYESSFTIRSSVIRGIRIYVRGGYVGARHYRALWIYHRPFDLAADILGRDRSANEKDEQEQAHQNEQSLALFWR